MSRIAPVLGFAALLVALWLIAGHFGIAAQAGPNAVLAFVSLALLLVPYWAFGFGAADWLTLRLTTPLARIAAAPLLLVPYLVFAIPTGQFRWILCGGLLAVILVVAGLLETARLLDIGWREWLVLALLALAVESHVFDRAWVIPGLSAIPKLLMVDLGLYAFLVVRPIGGVGYDFRPRGRDFAVGLREFLYFTPIALLFGLATAFLHFHATPSSPGHFAAGWIFTLFFIAVPEELFFRGLLLNLLERKIGMRWALATSSVLFGLAHFNKRAAFFNWRYVILSAIAGLFYARAWRDRRRVLTSSITHATVDTVWSIWLR
jgi:membrane protease YdiL (CAAX protease family)